jgi:hypothetical protein
MSPTAYAVAFVSGTVERSAVHIGFEHRAIQAMPLPNLIQVVQNNAIQGERR